MLLAGTAAFVFSLWLVDAMQRAPIEDATAVAASQMDVRQRRGEAAQRWEELHRAQAAATAAQEQARELRNQLGHLRRLLSDAEVLAAAGPVTTPGGAASATVDAATAAAGKEKAEIERQLSDLEGRRASLLKDLTPAHPRVAALVGEIEQLRLRQSRLPQADEHAAAEGSRKTEPATVPTARWLAAIEKLKSQQQAVDRAADENVRLIVDEEAAVKRLAPAQGEAAAPISRRPPPRSTPPRWPGALIAVAFTVLAASAARLWRIRSGEYTGDPLVTSAEALEAALQAPVLGVIRPAEASEARQAA